MLVCLSVSETMSCTSIHRKDRKHETKPVLSVTNFSMRKKTHSIEMPWLPDEKNPCYNKVDDDITKLLDTFGTMLMSGSDVGQGQDQV